MLHAVTRMIVGLDQALNPIVYGGSENVTISSQSAYRELVQKKSAFPRRAIDWVFRTFFGQKHHCYKSLLVEVHEFFGEEPLIYSLLAEQGIVVIK
jgi:hypothetical protein